MARCVVESRWGRSKAAPLLAARGDGGALAEGAEVAVFLQGCEVHAVAR